MTTPQQNFGFMDYLLDYADRARENRAKANSAPRVELGPDALFRGDFIDPRVPIEDVGRDVGKAARDFSTSVPAFFVGAPGDIAQAGMDTGAGLGNFARGVSALRGGNFPPPKVEVEESPFTSASIQRSLGGDPNSMASIVGAVGTPDPLDGVRLLSAAKGLLANPKMLAAVAPILGIPRKVEKPVGALGPLAARPKPQDVNTNINVAELPAPTMEARIGTTGAYRGGPQHITSPQSRQGLRTRVLSMVEEGAPGRLWYDVSSQSNLDLAAGLPGRRDRLAGFQSITSPSTEIKGNQGFAIKGFNQAAVGDSIKAGIFPNDMGRRLERVAAGDEVTFPPKQGPFFQGISQNPGDVVSRPTNDIRMGRAYEFDKGKDFDFSQGFTEAQHRWMDGENEWMVDYANRNKLGGHDDWNVERVQASIWVSQKARQEGISIEQAAFDFATDLESRTVSIASESTPSTSLNHLTGVTDSPVGKQTLFDRQTGLLTDEGGRDVVATTAGALTRPSIAGEGLYEGVVNPVNKTQILGATDTGSQVLDDPSAKLSGAIAGFHGLVKGQDTTAIKFLRRAESAGLRNSARIDLPDGQISTQKMGKLQERLDSQFGPGNALADFNEGGVDILVINLDEAGSSAIAPQGQRIAESQSAAGGLLDPVKRPAALTRQTNATNRAIGIKPKTGLLDERSRGPVQNVRPDRFAKSFQEEISNSVEDTLGIKLTPDNFKDNTAVRAITDGPAPGLLGDFGGYKPSEHLAAIDAAGPEVVDRLDPLVRWTGRAFNDLDDELAATIPNAGKRSDILVTAREALAEGGFDRLRELVKAGVLPAVVLGVFAGASQPGSQDAGSF